LWWKERAGNEWGTRDDSSSLASSPTPARGGVAKARFTRQPGRRIPQADDPSFRFRDSGAAVVELDQTAPSSSAPQSLKTSSCVGSFVTLSKVPACFVEIEPAEKFFSRYVPVMSLVVTLVIAASACRIRTDGKRIPNAA
jgi:hypothetical protein